MTYELAEPRAASLIEALRSVGYTIQTAIADLVDNSITATARNVWLDFVWEGRGSVIVLTDDGVGMNQQELSDAMRPGTRSPLEARAPGDLGRFGLGLKTASFSQARSLTVASKRAGGALTVRRWDLDYVGTSGEWRLLTTPSTGSDEYLSRLNSMRQGTVVLWQQLDRVVGDAKVGDRAAQDRFLATARSVNEQLAMVFHQFLTGPRAQLSIFINGAQEKNRVKPWDPFCEAQMATFSPSDAEKIRFRDSEVAVKGFVLPHKDKLTEEEYRLAAGPAGWNAQQGFYVYRNRRLLVAGGWLDLGYTTEEHHKLARIRVEIPNATDAEWSIDVKKSRARPPAGLRPRLREIADVVRLKAREIYAHRGRAATGPTEPLRRAWLPVTRDGRLYYKVDRSHVLAKLVLAEASGPQKKSIEALLRLLEATVPVQQIWLDAAEKPEQHAAPFQGEPPAHLREVMVQLYRALRADGISGHTAKQRIANMEPFNNLPALVGTLDDIED